MLIYEIKKENENNKDIVNLIFEKKPTKRDIPSLNEIIKEVYRSGNFPEIFIVSYKGKENKLEHIMSIGYSLLGDSYGLDAYQNLLYLDTIKYLAENNKKLSKYLKNIDPNKIDFVYNLQSNINSILNEKFGRFIIKESYKSNGNEFEIYGKNLSSKYFFFKRL